MKSKMITGLRVAAISTFLFVLVLSPTQLGLSKEAKDLQCPECHAVDLGIGPVLSIAADPATKLLAVSCSNASSPTTSSIQAPWKWLPKQGQSGMLTIWDDKLRLRKTLEVPSDPVYTPIRKLVHHPDTREMLGVRPAGAGKELAKLDLKSMQVKICAAPYSIPVWSAAFSNDGEVLAIGQNDGYVTLSSKLKLEYATQIDEMHVAYKFQAHERPVNDIDVSRVGNHFLLTTTSWNGVLKCWEFSLKERPCQRFSHNGGPPGAYINIGVMPETSRLVYTNQSQIVTIVNMVNGQEEARLYGHRADVSPLAVTKNLISTGDTDGTIIVWDALAGKEIKRINCHNSAITALCFINGGESLISGDRSGRLCLHSIRKIGELGTAKGTAKSGGK